ncbi:MAG TPA: DUF418 domain-containing protein [Sphingomicrobium sp.]|nr:DUF418 domain-containing protein [Sphingomicrobium sp.]
MDSSVQRAQSARRERLTNPLPSGQRIEVLDVIRGIAVCGILAVNIFVMGTIGATQGRTFPAEWNADWIAWITQRVLLEGPMRGLFMVLFGAGMLLMLKSADGPEGSATPIDAWARRCLALLLFGVIHFLVLMWPGEILWTLGVAGLALLAFRTAKVRTLWIWALVIIACLSLHRAYDTSTYVATYEAALHAERAKASGVALTAEQQTSLDAAVSTKAANYPSEEAMAAEFAQRTQLPSLLSWSASGWSFRHLGVYSWIGVAESLAFMLVGMALFRSGFLTGERQARTYWQILVAAGAIGLSLRGADYAWQARTAFELDIHRLNPLMSWLRSGWYQPARLALTLAYVAMIVLMVKGSWLAWKVPFSALGRMALTNYTLQSILTALLFYALGYLGAFGAAGLLAVAFAICVITGVFSMIWLNHFSIGPLEWLLRRIAYGTLSGGKRGDGAAVPAQSPSL